MRTEPLSSCWKVINQVGAVSLHANLNCDQMANSHTSTAHYDKNSFVGLAWRPPAESVCCEIYSTGRANLPGSTRERELLKSFARMLPQLLLHSDHPERIELCAPHLRDCHKPDERVLASNAVVHNAGASKHNKKKEAKIRDIFDDDMEDDDALPPLVATTSLDMTDADDTLLDGMGF